MNKLRIIALTIGLAGSFASANAGQPTGDLVVVPKTEEAVAGGMRQYDFQSIGRSLGTRVIHSIAHGRVLVVRPPKGVNWQEYRKTLLATGTYASVEPNTVAMPTAIADDPSLNTQWHLFQISAPRAWDFETGTQAPILAVVDGGVDLTHPDLAPNLVSGYNTISGLAQSAGGAVNDITMSGHGTRTAGVAAARGNNAVGVSGVGWYLRLMPIRATDTTSGATPRSELLEGIQWAVNNGAKVVSVSYTEVQFEDVQTMGEWARTQGALLVWSAGNSNTNWSTFDHEDVTVVGGTDQSDARWQLSATSGSGYGRGVDCFAPCTQIYTIRKGGTYGNAPAGVSFAVPQVAATLALMMGRSPTVSATEIERRMLLRCGNLGPLGNDINFGFGRLNAGAAVEWPIRKYQLQTLSTAGITGVLTDVIPWRIIDDGRIFGTVARSGMTDAVVIWNPNGSVNIWYPSENLFPPGGTAMEIRDVNESGVMVGVLSTTYPAYRGLYWSQNVASYLIDAGFPRTYWNGINNAGENVGLGMVTFTNKSGRYRNAVDGVLTNPISSPPYNISSSNSFWKISEDGTIIGSLFSQEQPFLFHPDRGITYCDAPFVLGTGSMAGGQITDSTEEGAFIGIWSTNLGTNNFANFGSFYNSKGRRVEDYGVSTGVYSATLGMNENIEVVGATQDSETTFQAALIMRGFNPGLMVDKLAPLANDPNNVLPPTVTGLKAAYDVNNLGQVTVQARTTLARTIGMIANPIDTPGVAVSLGQLGSTPTYIGSIPPALSVTFTDGAGVPYPGGTTQLSYASAIGRLNLTPPASVTGNYRVYMRCNSAAIPGYTGTPFLNRLYPPLNEPAVPRDAFYLPYDSPTSFNNQPILEMYPGDVDQSGEVDAADIDMVIATFGQVNGDPGFGPTDVDGTGEIDASDIDLVIANFGLTGDPEP